MSEWITIKTADGDSFDAYVAKPEGGNGPAVLVIQEIFGVNANLRAISDKLAGDGFIAVAPDLFWRQERRVDITDQTEEEWAKAFELYKGFNVDKGVKDLGATLEAARKIEGSTGKVGCVGYCLGGLLAYLMATRTDIDASVGYYGVGIDGMMTEAANIRNPLLLHIAEEDGFVDKEAQAKIHQGLGGNDLVALIDYAGVDHGFTRKGGQHYDEAAATKANKTTLDFLKTNLKD